MTHMPPPPPPHSIPFLKGVLLLFAAIFAVMIVVLCAVEGIAYIRSHAKQKTRQKISKEIPTCTN